MKGKIEGNRSDRVLLVLVSFKGQFSRPVSIYPIIIMKIRVILIFVKWLIPNSAVIENAPIAKL